MSETGIIRSRLEFTLENQGALGVNLTDLHNNSPVVVTVNEGDETNVAIPDGFSAVAWVKYSEAKAILVAFSEGEGQEYVNDRNVGFRTTFFEVDHELARKFHSQVQLQRIAQGNVRKSFWPREEEMRALIEAQDTMKDVDFPHLQFGKGGKIQFLPEGHPAVKKYRSQTRLLRKR